MSSEFTSLEITPDTLDSAIADILEEYGDVVYEATEEGLTAAEKVLINNLKVASPKKTGQFAKKWKGKGKKYKLRRYVGNTTMVKSGGKEIPLANILEYSTEHGKPFIKHTYDSSVDEMARAAMDEIKKGV